MEYSGGLWSLKKVYIFYNKNFSQKINNFEVPMQLIGFRIKIFKLSNTKIKEIKWIESF